jgi:hypothetical protein
LFFTYLDINECEQPNDCHKYANCNNTIGSFKCKCKEGYEGDGVSCSGIGYARVVELFKKVH